MTLIEEMEQMKLVVAGVRNVQKKKNIAKKEQLSLEVSGENPIASLNDIVKKMANLSNIINVKYKSPNTSSFLVGTTEFSVLLEDLIDKDAEIKKIQAEISHLENFLSGVNKKLSNERFVANAPDKVVELERKKQSDATTKLISLRETLNSLL